MKPLTAEQVERIKEKPLAAKTVEHIKPSDKREEYPDAIVPGLYLIVQPGGHKSWAVRYRLHGRPAKHTIGRFPAVDLAKARAEARAVIEGIQLGKPPRQVRADADAAAPRTFAWLAEQFVERYARSKNNQGEVKKRTWKEDQRNLRNEFGAWANRTASSITSDDVLALIETKAATAPIRARRLFALIRKVFGWAVGKKLLPANPAANIKPGDHTDIFTKEEPRKHSLYGDELLALQRALPRLEWPWRPIVQLCLLSGQRRGEVAGMRWDELDLEKGEWLLPEARTKGKREHVVPLTGEMVEIIAALPRLERSPLLFPAQGANDRPASGFSKAKLRLDALMTDELRKMSEADGKPREFRPWRVHDLRRTCATAMQRLNVMPFVVSKLLNHSLGASASMVTKIYATYDYLPERRAALEAWSKYLKALREGKNGNNIIQIVGRAA